MTAHTPCFIIRPIDERCWVIDAYWPDQRLEELSGVFVSELDARRWLRGNAAEYLRQRRPQGGCMSD